MHCQICTVLPLSRSESAQAGAHPHLPVSDPSRNATSPFEKLSWLLAASCLARFCSFAQTSTCIVIMIILWSTDASIVRSTSSTTQQSSTLAPQAISQHTKSILLVVIAVLCHVHPASQSVLTAHMEVLLSMILKSWTESVSFSAPAPPMLSHVTEPTLALAPSAKRAAERGNSF